MIDRIQPKSIRMRCFFHVSGNKKLLTFPIFLIISSDRLTACNYLKPKKNTSGLRFKSKSPHTIIFCVRLVHIFELFFNHWTIATSRQQEHNLDLLKQKQHIYLLNFDKTIDVNFKKRNSCLYRKLYNINKFLFLSISIRLKH